MMKNVKIHTKIYQNNPKMTPTWENLDIFFQKLKFKAKIHQNNPKIVKKKIDKMTKMTEKKRKNSPKNSPK